MDTELKDQKTLNLYQGKLKLRKSNALIETTFTVLQFIVYHNIFLKLSQ